MRFVYVMDPMCSWCYGFQPELESFLSDHKEAAVNWIMGGLARDDDQPMDEELRRAIASYWYKIEAQTQVRFNHEYWEQNTPYRSTYLACRAVIAAENLRGGSSSAMVKSIQKAYYQQAKNPSLEQTLIDCARLINIDESRFGEALKSNETEERLQQHLNITRQLQVSGFPALFYVNDQGQAYPLTLGYCQSAVLEERFDQLKSRLA